MSPQTEPRIEIERVPDARYRGKYRARIVAVDGVDRVWLGEVQEIAKTGRWYFNRGSGWDHRKQGGYETQEEAIAQLIAAEEREYQALLQRAQRQFRVTSRAAAAWRLERGQTPEEGA